MLSDLWDEAYGEIDIVVSMHLLVLSAFRLGRNVVCVRRAAGLNAPFGAQCFPTQIANMVSSKEALVSMHLLVLSAFRR